jgi:hypothetical protein
VTQQLSIEERIAKDPEHAAKPAYISRCRKCNGMTGCCTDDDKHAKETARFASEVIRDGQILEHGCVSDVWAATWCNCHEPPQAGLFDEVTK